jgi:cytochrome c5
MSEHMSDASFGKVFAGMLAGLVALTIFLIILAHFVGGGTVQSNVQLKAKDAVTLARTTPAGSVAVGDVADQVASAAPAETLSGEQVYQSACAACHAAGVAGAPKFGDAAMWEPRIAQGNEVLYDHAINGFKAMPAKGGNVSLSDESVTAAVDYMTGN